MLNSPEVKKYSDDVQYLQINDKEIFIIGTAHISLESAKLVREVIENEKPDTVCVELDEQRFKALSDKKKWENLDLKTIIKNKQLSTLMINILLASYQKKMGEKLGVAPGVELLEAVNVAKDNNLNIELCDRDIRVTLRRAWNSMSFWQKMKFLASGLGGIFEDQEISEEQLAEIKKKDVLSEMLREIGEAMPVLKRVLIDERDLYLSEKIKNSNGKKIVAVVGAGHVQGILTALQLSEVVDLDKLNIIPKVSKATQILGWGIPALILGALVYIAFNKGASVAGDNLLFFILASSIPASIGVILSLGHPLTVLSALISAPITALTPLLAVGNVTALVQVYVSPPIVKEFQDVVNDVRVFKMWWKNKLLKVLLIFILSSLFASIGNIVGMTKIFKNLF